MSNVTDAIGNFFSGGSSGSSSLGNVLGSFGNILSGIGGAASQTGGVDPNTGEPIGSAAQSADASQAATNLVNPSQSAQAAITAGQDAPTQGQTQNPQGPNQQSGQNQNFAPQNAVQQLAKALQKAQQGRQTQNPYQTGGGQGANQPQAQVQRGGPAPQGAQPADLPSQYASAMEFSNDNPPPDQGYPAIDPSDAYRAGLRTNAPDTGFRIPGAPANENAPPTNFNDYLNNLRQGAARPAGGGGAPAAGPVAGGTGGPPGTPPSGNAGPALGGLARALGLTLPDLAPVLGPAGVLLGNTSPAETGELPYGGYKGDTSSFAPPKSDTYRPEDDPSFEQPRGAPGREDKAIDPRTGKPFPDPPAVDPKTGKKLPTKKGGPLPTKVPTKKDGSPDERFAPGHYVPTTGIGRGPGTWVPGSMMRDVQGGQSIPPLLGEIAQMAIPLLGGLIGGFGGGGRRGIRGFGMYRGGGRHFGGGGPFGGHWPYHHPQHGWDLHGDHPGQGWRPMDPRHFRDLMGGRYGNRPLGFAGGQGGSLTGNPQLDQWLSSLGLDGGDGQNQGGGRNQVGFGDTSSYDPYYDKGSRYRQPGEPSATVTGKGPDGQALPYSGQDVANFTDQVAGQLGMDPNVAKRIIAGESSYGQNYSNLHERNGYPSYGPMQFNMAPGAVGDAFKRATGEDPRDPSTWKDQIVFGLRWAQAHGWTPWGAARDAGIPQWAGIKGGGKVPAFAWDYGHAGGGKTATGGSIAANPTGNAPVQVGEAGGLPVYQ